MGIHLMSTITRVDIIPSYAKGFSFSWEVSQALADAAPWTFTVEQAPAPAGPWTPVSPEIRGRTSWAETEPRRLSKDAVLYFRVRLKTATGTYYSEPRMPYGDLDRREFLLARDIMRREVLHMRTGAGTLARLWLVAVFGPRCPVCINPVTGDVRDSNCSTCKGTGRSPAYYGPYDVWCSFSNTRQTTQMAGDGTGTRQPKTFSIRMIGAPLAKKNDLVVDTASDKRYYVDDVQVVAELRRVPVVQVLTAHEAPVSDIAYKVTE